MFVVVFLLFDFIFFSTFFFFDLTLCRLIQVCIIVKPVAVAARMLWNRRPGATQHFPNVEALALSRKNTALGSGCCGRRIADPSPPFFVACDIEGRCGFLITVSAAVSVGGWVVAVFVSHVQFIVACYVRSEAYNSSRF